jgi:simple sugar transport system ATP-binding protein
MRSQPFVELSSISKSFGDKANSKTVLDNVSLSIIPGTIHALLGENGAGKTTLMNILYGLLQADTGNIKIDGKLFKRNHTSNAISYAIEAGICMVHQHFMLVEQLTVLENIILGTKAGKYGILYLKSEREKLAELKKTSGIELDADTKVKNLSLGGRQKLEILKALYRGCRLLILDEPTAVLNETEISTFFLLLQNLAKTGIAIIFISHKFGETLKICDTVSVLRKGKLVETLDTK